MKKNFDIGQLVYILSDKKESIIPGIVVEKAIIETLSGNSVSWKMKIGPEGNAQIINTNEINSEIYGSLEEASNVLRLRLNDFIQQLVVQAQNRSLDWYKKESTTTKQPDEASSALIKQQMENVTSKEEFRDRLKELMMSPEQEEIEE